MKQSTDLFLDDCLDKVEKLRARDATVASLERQVLAQMGEEAYFRMKDEAEAGARHWTVAAGEPMTDAEFSRETERPKRGTPLLMVGGILLGLSVITIAAGVAVVFTDAAIIGAIMLTVGGLHFIGGLVTIIIGAVLRSNS